MRYSSVVLAGALVLSACARSSEPKFGDIERVHAESDVGTAPILATSTDGVEAAAWVSAPNGGSDGRLHVRAGDVTAVLRDSLGPIEPHGEAPPKLAWSTDGSLNALYVVAKLVPGRRFPASALRFVRSPDGGRSWSSPVTVTDDSTFGSHNFHALYAAPDGPVYASWLDGRAGKSTVFMSRSDDGGRTWASNVRVTAGEACPCCRTTMASSKDGSLFIAWREVMPGNVRDVVVARSSDQGRTWGAPVRAHADDWVFDGCPHAGPSMLIDGEGRLHIAWWTGKKGAAGVWYAHSDDGAQTFSKAEPLGVADFSRPAHVQLALGGQDRLFAAWDDGTVQTPRVVLRASKDRGGEWGDQAVLSDSAMAAGFPVVTASRERVTVAWSQERAAGVKHDSHNMKDPKAQMPLGTVGAAQVVARRAAIE